MSQHTHKKYIVGGMYQSVINGGYNVYDFLRIIENSFKLPEDFKYKMSKKYGNAYISRVDDFINIISENLEWDVVSVSKDGTFYTITFIQYIEDINYL